MADMNYRILKEINKEIKKEVSYVEGIDSSNTISIGDYVVLSENQDRFKNLLKLKELLEKANKQDSNLYVFGEIGISREDYLSFMRLLHDEKTDIRIPKNLYAFGLIPKYNIVAPPIAADNMSVNEIEELYQKYYANYGIAPEYENGVRKPYPHEMFDWNKDGAIDSTYGKAHNYYYEKRYLVAKQQELNDTEEKKEEEKNETSKRFHVNSRRQATEEEKDKMSDSVDKSKDSTVDKRKRLRRTLILSGIALGITFIAFNASVVIPAVISNPAMLGSLLIKSPGFVLQNFGSLLLHIGIPATVATFLVRAALRKCNKGKKNEDGKEENENDKANENVNEKTVNSKELIAQYRAQIMENEKRLKEKDAEIEQAKKTTIPTNQSTTTQEQADNIRKLQEERNELLRLKHQILDEMARHTQIPEANGGMKR